MTSMMDRMEIDDGIDSHIDEPRGTKRKDPPSSAGDTKDSGITDNSPRRIQACLPYPTVK